MKYEIKNYDSLLGIDGFGEQLLKNHFTLYQGYVNNFNKLDELLVTMEKEGKYSTPEYAELNRRLGWEFDGMRLHELYFGNLCKGGKVIDAKGKLYAAIAKEFGSYDFWEKDFRAMGAMRGIGWVVLYYDKATGRLFNVWINEHDVGHFSGCVPLLVMDVFEHAYMIDYGLKKVDYINAFFKNIDWDAVEKRM